jgi:hypothetical protein
VKALELLFTSWIGLLSLFTVVFMIGMAAYLYIFVTRHMKEPGE